MNTPLSYTDALDALGLYVERAGGADVFVNELHEGFLVSFVADDKQHVATLGLAELAQLHAEGARQKGGFFRRREARGETSVRLRAAGRFLDSQTMAAALVLQERADGYELEYTGLVDLRDEFSGITRRYEMLDSARLQALSG